jgi:hypothetical protein
MLITAFAPLFLLMAMYAALGARQWMTTTMLASFFQAASPLVLVVGSRVGGLTPAYILLIIGFFHWLRAVPTRDTVRTLDAQTLSLAALTVVGVAGAIILPRLFEGVMVLPPRGGLDTGFLQAVRPSSGNYIQAFYLICNFLFFFLTARFLALQQFTLADCLSALKIGVMLTVFLGIYQLISYHFKLPWPRSIINSNAGVSQQYEQMFLGVRRMSATFLEPSQMAFYFVALFALFGIGLRQKLPGLLLFICLLLSTSSSAYLGIIGMFAIWLVLEIRRNSVMAFLAIFLLATTAVAIYCADEWWSGGQLIHALLLDKLSSISGISRAHADSLAYQAMLDSYGFGVGVGSARASSLIATLAATMGVPGMLCFFAFMFFTLRSCFRGGRAIDRALGYAMAAFLVIWIVSVPDLALPLPWILAGMISGAVRQHASGSMAQPARVQPFAPALASSA